MTVWPNGSKSRPKISSNFGMRYHPTSGQWRLHAGVDFIGFREIRAVESGTVRVVGTPGGWAGGGRQVWIQHDGFFTRSMHLASTNVSVGQKVSEGQVIGIMGMTGTATGIHLHLELQTGALHYSNTGQIDPVPFIQRKINESAGGGGSPLPVPTPLTKEELMATGVIYTDDAADKNRSGAIINTQSGLFSAFGWFSKSYADQLAKGFGLPAAGQVTRGQYDVLRKDMAELRASNQKVKIEEDKK